jgi:hypothetical protein
MKKTILILCLIPIITLIPACRKTNDHPAAASLMITPTGTSKGQLISKTIDANGGSLSSADGKLTITIPAAALSAATIIGVEPISNENKAGAGNGYRLTPHNMQFSKPVTLSFTYSDADITGSAPELLGIAYQDSTGGWQAIGGIQLDKASKKITGTTTHFSDWSFFESCFITPASASIALNESIELIAVTVMDIDPENPIVGTRPLKDPAEIQASVIKNWQCSAGTIASNAGAKATFKAPGEMPSGNPVAVNAVLNLKQADVMMLVANITIKGSTGIDFLEVDESENKLYLFDDSFGNDPGSGKRSVKVGGTEAVVELWTPSIIVCKFTA